MTGTSERRRARSSMELWIDFSTASNARGSSSPPSRSRFSRPPMRARSSRRDAGNTASSCDKSCARRWLDGCIEEDIRGGDNSGRARRLIAARCDGGSRVAHNDGESARAPRSPPWTLFACKSLRAHRRTRASLDTLRRPLGRLAQLVEHRLYTASVAGSSPAALTLRSLCLHYALLLHHNIRSHACSHEHEQFSDFFGTARAQRCPCNGLHRLHRLWRSGRTRSRAA